MDVLKNFLEGLPNYRKLKSKSYPNECEELVNRTSFLPKDVGMAQRAWHILNNKQSIPSCEVCGNEVSWWIRYKKYRTLCSNVCVGSSDNTKTKRKETCLNSMGTATPAQSEEIRNKMSKTLFEHWGVSHPMQHPAIKQKAVDTWMSKHQSNHPSYFHLSTSTIDKLNDRDWLIKQHHTNKMSLTDMRGLLEDIDISALSRHMRKFDIEIIRHGGPSAGEGEVGDFCRSIYSGKILTNDRKIISPLELDIVIPELRIAIEYCGVYWHSEQLGKDRNYHVTKMELAAKKGYQLFTIFEDEWRDSSLAVQSKIRHLLNGTTQTRYARQCQIRTINYTDRNEFLNKYHIQKNCKGTISFGLYDDESLVAVMVFTRTGNTDEYYLARYATKGNVPGGFSKLLSHFTTTHKWKKIISFADRRWSDGGVYKKNHWIFESIIPPDYSYSTDGLTREHKFNFRRKNLSKRLENFNENLSEKQNCDDNNILRIWDCGKIRYCLVNSTP